MIMPSASSPVETLQTCRRDGAPFLPSAGCGVCAFDARYADVPLDVCPECGAGLTGLTATCPGCDAAAAEAAGRLLHAELLREARRELPVLLAAFDIVPVLR